MLLSSCQFQNLLHNVEKSTLKLSLMGVDLQLLLTAFAILHNLKHTENRFNLKGGGYFFTDITLYLFSRVS